MWHCELVKGYASDLAAVLQRLTTEGWEIRFVNTNGIDTFMVTAYRTP